MKQRILDFMERDDYLPKSAEDLSAALKIEDGKLTEFFDALRALESEGTVILSKKKRYGLCRHMDLFSGRIEGKSGGYAFFIPDGRNRGDIYIPAEGLHGALHGDRVLVRVIQEQHFVNGKDEGEVTRIISRANSRIIGVFNANAGGGVVVPDEKRISCEIAVPKSLNGGAEDGDVVTVAITSWPERGRLRGKVIEVIGRKNRPGMDMETVIHKYQLPAEFPDEVLIAAERSAKKVLCVPGERRDLRELLTVTMDGADAKDLDDAVSLEYSACGNYLLGVHIADVGNYVPAGSALDKEAYRRGTSVYFPDRVLPMLPPVLSNGVCSLNPKEDRLTLSCLMEIDKKGRVIVCDIFESVIRSSAKLTYEHVNAVLAGKEEETAGIKSLLEGLNRLRTVLFNRRKKRGALNFDFPEAKVLLDDRGEPVEIRKRVQGKGESIIEECMIAANESVASYFEDLDVPFIYRVHDRPGDESILELHELLAPFGYYLSRNMYDVRPYHFSKLLEKIGSSPERQLLEMMILRTMNHAVYDTENRGHFGLASDCYCHFTSPIRRYPDLCIHRVIKDFLHYAETDEEKTGRLYRRLKDAALQSSDRERRAEDAEREALDVKKAKYMASHIDEKFEGVISGVTAYGFYVELENTVNGLVHVSSLEDDFYEYHENTKTLMGRKTGTCFKLGDSVRVSVLRVNIDEHLIDFALENQLGRGCECG